MPYEIFTQIDILFIEMFNDIVANKPGADPIYFQECLSDWAAILTEICKNPEESLAVIVIQKSIDENSTVLEKKCYTTILTELLQHFSESPNLSATHLKHFSPCKTYYNAWASFYDALHQKNKIIQRLINYEAAYLSYRSANLPSAELITVNNVITNASKIITHASENVINTVKLNFISSQSSENFIGTKAAKLIELEKLSKTLNSLGLAIKVQVPELTPLNHLVISNHLDVHYPTWQDDWKTFVEAQPKESTTITYAANLILKKMRNTISTAFTNHTFSAFETLKPFVESLQKSALLMIRSTGKEDTVDIANPGGNESIPAVALEEEAITNAIGDVVASYFSDKSLMQRLLSGDDITEPPFMPVLIQRMIGESFDLKSTKNKQIIKSGVMYAQKNGIRIQLAPGHGELVVNSKGTFDSYVVTNENVVYPEIYHKSHRLIPKLVSENGRMVTKLELQRNSKTLSDSPSLSLNTALSIAKVGRHIHKHFDMPMDIEFVYDESENTLSLVQARPIPKGDVKAVMPSAIAPDKLPDIKKNSEIHNTFVITPAGYASHVISNKNQIIVSDTIEQALTQYLKPRANLSTKIVIVKEIAPATSHAAAQFNAKAIPVFAVDDLQSVQEWLLNPFTIIADIQHKLLVKLANPTTEISLYDNETLKKGMFKSSLPTQLTLMPQIVVPKYKNALPQHVPNTKTRTPLMIGDLIENIHSQNEKLSQKSFYELTDSLFTFLTKKWPKIQIPNNNSYTFLIKQIEFLESAKPQQKDSQDFIHALHSILSIFYRLAYQDEDNHVLQMLLQQAMITAIEIKDQLRKLENADDENINEAQEEYLNLISKLEALIINPGNSQLFSHSLHQIFQEEKAFQQASKVDGFEWLTYSQQMYFVQFHKLSKLALNEKAAAVWNQFAMQCCQSQEKTFKLAHLIQFNLKNNMAADWINNLSPPSWFSWLFSPFDYLDAMRNNSVKAIAELTSLGIEKTRTVIDVWEQNIPLWSNPRQFDKLWGEFQNEFLSLLNKHVLSPGLTSTSQKIILKNVQDLTEIFDKTIKAVKGSCEYTPNDQLKNFITLLEPYHALMHKWVSYIPDALFQKWNEKIVEGSNLKYHILLNIESRFRNLSLHSDTAELYPSGSFCVSSAKIGSTATFNRQFIQRSVTLEDMFTLFHQNILTSLTLLSPEKIDYSRLPEIIQPFLNEFRTLKTRPLTNVFAGTREQVHSLECLSVTHQYPIISIDYNLPLRNHASKFIIEYNQQTQQTQLHAKFFGGNWSDRMTSLCRLAHIEAQFLNIIEKRNVVFNESALSIEFTWGLTKKQTQDAGFSRLLKNIMCNLSECTFTTFEARQEDFNTLLCKYSPIQLMSGLKRYSTSPRTNPFDNENEYIKEYILPIAIRSRISLKNWFTSSDITEFFKNGKFDDFITKPYTLEKLNKLKETYDIDIPWSEKVDGTSLLEGILLNGCSNEEFIQIIQSNNIKLSDYPDILYTILSENNYPLIKLFEKHCIDLSNQRIYLRTLYKLYTQQGYFNLCKNMLSANLQITNADYLVNSQTYTTFINLVAPHLVLEEQARLFIAAISGNHDVAITALLATHSKDDIINSINTESWIDLLYSNPHTLLKYVEHTYLLKQVEYNIDHNITTGFCSTVIVTCLKNNLALYPTLSKSALEICFELYGYRVYLLPKLTIKMVLSLIKQYPDGIQLNFHIGQSSYKRFFLYDLLRTEFDVQDFIELNKIVKFDTRIFTDIYNIIFETKNDRLLKALAQQNIVFQNQSIKLDYFCLHYSNKELVPILVSLMQEPTRSIDMWNIHSLNLTEDFRKQFCPLLKPEEKALLDRPVNNDANTSRMGLFSQQRPHFSTLEWEDGYYSDCGFP